MTTNETVTFTVDVDALNRIFLEMLKNEELIGNNTYAFAMDEILKKGAENYVNHE